MRLFILINVLILTACTSNNSSGFEVDVPIATFIKIDNTQLPFKTIEYTTSYKANAKWNTVSLDTFDFFPNREGIQSIKGIEMTVSSTDDSDTSYHLFSDCIDSLQFTMYIVKKNNQWEARNLLGSTCFD